MANNDYEAGKRAYHVSRYGAITRARLANGLHGNSLSDKEFRRGFEEERRRESEEDHQEAEWSV